MKSYPKPKINEFKFGSYKYQYELIKQKRNTLSLTVKPDLSVYLKCPLEADNERIQKFLTKKWSWLEKQLNFFRKYQRKTYQKEYLSGEGFLYLGRRYKLILKKASEEKVTAAKGLFVVHTNMNTKSSYLIKRLIDRWYKEKTIKILNHRFDEIKQKFDYKSMPELVIKSMQKRWGSYLNKNIVVLNPKLIHTPRECIDYVIVHELCHKKYKKHDKNFYKFLNKQYPKWEKVKDRLESIGVELS